MLRVVSLQALGGGMTREDGNATHDGIDRRTFLKVAPRHVLDGVRGLMSDLGRFASPLPAGREQPATRRIAMLDVSRCLAWGVGGCQLCYLQCPRRDGAIVLESGRPTVVLSGCDGCGVCVDVCRTTNDLGAIQLIDAPPLLQDRL